jgi:hypothetical protein
MKMSEQEYDVRYTQILEHWEAKRKEILEYAEGDSYSAAICESADLWKGEQLAKLYQASQWSLQEFSAWMQRRSAQDFEKVKKLSRTLGIE